ncbi:unnamed protein product [Vitrella brassicaformis CCMP3155]|uniref:Protein kinase domain-containing protein n=1 Tax=Vitrella brassicaformis (strain CCMP3155) TaxID=1169540 RepID=A0A0G4FEM0_VITBC|nr:unnamed protein product [Vitrella brassicaformis CCMP3155]|eukprot:CEM11429.1 unnamed protein product [Vitrella brassicaformis CCMP3155]
MTIIRGFYRMYLARQRIMLSAPPPPSRSVCVCAETLYELKGPLSEPTLMRIGEGIIRAVEYLGQQGLVHGDIHVWVQSKNIGIRVRHSPPSRSSDSSSAAAVDGASGEGDGNECGAVLLDLDRLHDGIPGEYTLSIDPHDPHTYQQRPRPGILTHGRDLRDAVHWILQSFKQLGATQRLLEIFEDAISYAETQPDACACHIILRLRDLRQVADDEERRTPPLSPPSLRLPWHQSPQLDVGRGTTDHRKAPAAAPAGGPFPGHLGGPPNQLAHSGGIIPPCHFPPHTRGQAAGVPLCRHAAPLHGRLATSLCRQSCVGASPLAPPPLTGAIPRCCVRPWRALAPQPPHPHSPTPTGAYYHQHQLCQ